MVTIGVLGMQGAIREHVRMLEALGARTVVVRSVEDLESIDGLVLPGERARQCGDYSTVTVCLNHFERWRRYRCSVHAPV